MARTRILEGFDRMHIPDAILSGPVLAASWAVALGGLGVAVVRLRPQARDRATVMTGMMAAFVFAAQMVNFPILLGASGHLIGGVLASVVLGPWGAAVAMSAILIVQAFLFADGGVTALGANFLNMGLINAVLGYAIYCELRKLAGGGAKGTLIAAMLAAWISVILSAGACSVELAASGRWNSFLPILGMMTLVHSVIGLGEALITGLVLQSILSTRPDLISHADLASENAALRWGRVALVGLSISVAVAVFLGPFASPNPDGFEFVTEKLGVSADSAAPAAWTPATAVMPDYQFQLPGLASIRIATALAGAVGTFVVFAVAAILARTLNGDERKTARTAACEA